MNDANHDERSQNNQQFEHVAQRLAGRTALKPTGELDLLGSVGGLRGIAEAILPTLVFLIAFVVTEEVWTSALWALGLALAASALRIVQKQPIVQALAGAFGVAISAAVALLQDDAGGYFVPGFYISAIYGLVFFASMIAKWPVMGLIFGWIRGEGVTWQKFRLRRRKYQLATLLMVLVFAARLAVQLPLYLAEADVSLGVARLVMGVPLYALALWFGWLVSRPTREHSAQGEVTPTDKTPGHGAPGSTV